MYNYLADFWLLIAGWIKHFQFSFFDLKDIVFKFVRYGRLENL